MKSIRRKGGLDGQVDPAEGLRAPWKWPNWALRGVAWRKVNLSSQGCLMKGSRRAKRAPGSQFAGPQKVLYKMGCGEPEGQFDLQITIDS